MSKQEELERRLRREGGAPPSTHNKRHPDDQFMQGSPHLEDGARAWDHSQI